MSEIGGKKEGVIAAVAHMAAEWAHTPFPYLLGFGLMMAALHWDGHLQSQKGCFEVQQVGSKYFKVDTCNGKAEEIAVSQQPAKTGEKPQDVKPVAAEETSEKPKSSPQGRRP